LEIELHELVPDSHSLSHSHLHHSPRTVGSGDHSDQHHNHHHHHHHHHHRRHGINHALLKEIEAKLRTSMHAYRDRVSERAELLLDMAQQSDNAAMAQSLHSFIANTMHSLEDVGVRMLISYSFVFPLRTHEI
jgi:G3E family GTPase